MEISFKKEKSNLQDHFFLLVFAQNSWTQTTTDYKKENIVDAFFSFSQDANCKTCNSCDICNALAQLFDPYNPGEYQDHCNLCLSFADYYSLLQGENDGLILHAHKYYPLDSLLLFVEFLLKDDKTKKITIFQIPFYNPLLKSGKFDLENIRISYSEFEDFIEQKVETDDIDFGNTVYEIYKDNYY